MLPVILFVPGGGWVSGSGNGPLYDGSYLAKHGPAVVVTINYRVGVFGFLAHSDLAAEDPQHSTGDYGLLDQIAALRWVQDNIRSFGGDPSRLVLWGQSAGAWSTMMLLTSPPARGLFTRALSESGGTSARALGDAENGGAAFAAAAGCAANTLDCLRGLSATILQNSPQQESVTGWWAPVVDGYVLPQPVLAALDAGTQAHVPLMIGTTAREFSDPGITATPDVSTVNTEAEYENALAANFGASNGRRILGLYSTSSYSSPRAAYVAAVTDAFMTCATRRVATTVSNAQSEPVWRYYYNHTDSNGPLMQYGPGHFVDVPFWFGNFAGQLSPDGAELALGRAMATYLTRFAANGDPNAPDSGDGEWAPYLSAVDDTHQLATPSGEVDGVRTGECSMWNQVYPWEW